MRPQPDIERDDLDRLITWALAERIQKDEPSERVWQRIVRCISDSDRASGCARNQKKKSPVAVMGVDQLHSHHSSTASHFETLFSWDKYDLVLGRIL
ncbi:MAG: hypothetical protein SXV54_02745 [Chloroflexota bacterium]|nr:hypothetical protein [Chloroflexota bacterium]